MFGRKGNCLYLCTRKSAYCAGSDANNTLIKSNLAFKYEAVEVPFLSGFWCAGWQKTLEKGTLYINNIINFKLKCQD